MSEKITRAFKFDLSAEKRQAEDTQEKVVGRIQGRPIVYEQRTNMGPFDEIISAGALDDADLRDVALLVNHNTAMVPLARSRNNNANSTMQLTVVEEGMDIRADLDIERNATASETYSAVDRGDIDGMSFMFTIDGEEWEDLESDHPTRRITRINKVFETSLVTWPAYQQTSVETEARDRAALESARAALESARAEAEAEARAAKAAEIREKLNF